jgi:ribosome biogenesis GTPase
LPSENDLFSASVRADPSTTSHDTRLISIGWDGGRASEFAPFAAGGHSPGRVARVDGSSVLLITDEGAEDALVRGTGHTPAVGDWVACSRISGGLVVRGTLARTTALLRARPERDRERSAVQCLAANLDTVFIVQAANNLNVRRLEREAAHVRGCSIGPVVVLTKVDLCLDPAGPVLEARAAAPDCPVLPVNALTGEGMGELRRFIMPGLTSALLGASGVGKSTITNRFLGADVMETRGVREDDQRGRHTTTARYLHEVPGGGALIDTPGLRALGLVSGAGIDAAFPDVAELAARCRYPDCAHAAEPECAVLEAAESGELDPARLKSYIKMQREARYLDRKDDPIALGEVRRKWKGRVKGLRQRAKLDGWQ